MNHIYRSLWNEKLGTYVAVAETAVSAGKKVSSSRSGAAHFAVTALAAALCLGWGGAALANPVGGVVTAGSAAISSAPGSTTITQGSQNAAINWQSFNIGAGESVRFVQPNANAVALNRVVGGDPSSILGSLSANGKVFLVNPNGILFGRGASVNVGGLVASTLNITDSDFMAGRYRFAGSGTAGVNNQGRIDAPGGYVALLGANVSNTGVIAARMGSVALAAGQAVTLDVAGDGLLNLSVDQGAVKGLIDNGGLIQADGGQVLMTAQAAGNLLDTVVNNTGVVQAQSIDKRGGTIKLLGDMQSGTVNVGGTLDASAPQGGNGGFIETSAAKVRDQGALVTTAAPHGITGSWLIDPTNYNIAASGGDITGTDLGNRLKTTNVVIETVAAGSDAGNITVNDNVSWAANKLTLKAHNDIVINQAMRGSGSASLALQYGQASAAGTGSGYKVNAEVDLPSGMNFSTQQGSTGAVVNYRVINALGAPGSQTGADLQGIDGNLSGNYVLGSNIDARATVGWNGGAGWKSIGADDRPFTGRFDGLGHEIHGLTINRSSAGGAGYGGPAGDFGMFTRIGSSGQVRNLGLVNMSLSTGAAIYGYGSSGGLAGVNEGSIDNVRVSGSFTAFDYGRVGGLVGYNLGTIDNSHSSGMLTAEVRTPGRDGFVYGAGIAVYNGTQFGGATPASIRNSSSSMKITASAVGAGLVGQNSGGISNSFATGDVSGGHLAAGLVAYNGGTGSIDNSHATGNVVGAYNMAGGLVADNSGGSIDNSYFSGNVSGGSQYIGGIAGYSFGAIRNSYVTGNVSGAAYAGGIAGYSTTGGRLENVYSSGTVRSSMAGGAGGVVGTLNNSVVRNTYYNSTLNPGISAFARTDNTPSNGAGGPPMGAGLTTAQMKQASSFAGFNFTNTGGLAGNNWVMVNADGTLAANGGTAAAGTMPMLASEYSKTIHSAHQLQLMVMDKSASYTLGSSFSAAGTASTAKDIWGSTGFIPVGSLMNGFTGKLDGTGHIVSNLNIYRAGATAVGLFGGLGNGGAVANIGLDGGSITGGSTTGALVGYNARGTVSNSFSTAAVNGTSNVGGLVGANTIAASVTDSYATGTVIGSSGVGGLVGSNSGTVVNSYAAGMVMGNPGQSGGLVGVGNVGSVNNSFWNMSTSGQPTSGAVDGNRGIGLATAELNKLANYNSATVANGAVNPNWDLTKTWVVYDGQSAPLLRAFMKPLVVTVGSGTKVYDGTASGGTNTVSYSNVINGDVAGTLQYSTAGGVNVGTYAASASGLHALGGQTGYAISYVDGSMTVTQRQVSLNATKVYDGTTTANLAGATLTGLVGNETLNFSGGTAGDYSDKNVGAGKAITVTGVTLADGTGGGLASNYVFAGGTGEITAKALTVTGVAATTKTYDGTTSATLTGGTLAGLVAGETLGLSGLSGTFNDQHAGSGKAVTVTGVGLVDGTGLARNYTVGNPTGVVGTITPKALTVSGVSANSKTYDGNTTATLAGGTLNGLVAGETLFLGGLSAAFSDANAGFGKAVVVTGASLINGTGRSSNYTVSGPVGLTANINPKILTITGATAHSKTYDGTTAATLSGGTLQGLVAGETLTLAGLSGRFGNANAGVGKLVDLSSYVLVNGTGLASNYIVNSYVPGLVANINAKALTVSGVTAASKTYDGTDTAILSGGTLNGLVGTETLVLSGQSGAFGDKNAGVGKAVTVTGATLSNGTNGGLASNYTVTNATGVTANIDAKALTVSGVTAASKTYDGNDVATLSGGTLNGLVGSETLGLSGQTGTFSDKNAGSGKSVTVTGATLSNGTNGGLASNYTVTNATGVTADINAKALTVSGMTAASKTYDGTDAATLSGGTLEGLVGGETLVLSGQSGTFGDRNAGSGKAVTVTGATLGNGTGLASNYTVANPTGLTADINAKALTVSGVTAASKTYDGTTTATLSGGTLEGLVGAETLVLSGQSGTFDDKNAGTGKAVTVTGSTLSNGTNGGLASNYTVSNPTGVTGSITPKALTVSGVRADNKVYDGNAAATLSGGTLAGMVAGETLGLSGLSGTFDNRNAGSGKAVTVTGASLIDGSGLASNYTVGSPVGITADITAKALTVGGVTVADKSYDGTTAASLSGGTLVGLVDNETLTLSGQTGTFGDKNAGTGKAVTVTGATLGDGTGLASNYTVSNPTGVTGNITPKALTVSGVRADNKFYDGNATAALSGGTLAGMVAGETLGMSGLSGTFDDRNAGTGKAVTVTGASLIDGTGLASNYTVASPVGITADITAKALTVSGVTAADKTYDGTTAASLSGGTLVGLVGNETLTLSGQTGAFSDQNVGAGKAVTVTGATLGNGTGLASNYTVSNATGVTADITAKALTVTGVTAANKTYDGTTVATLSGGTLDGLVGNETLTLSGQTGAFSDQNAGAGKTVTVTGAALGNGTGLASNYTVSNATGVTADITAKALTVTGVTAANKTYDG
ncbi:YDG domain-containing protein, partial [Comamonas endophytica]